MALTDAETAWSVLSAPERAAESPLADGGKPLKDLILALRSCRGLCREGAETDRDGVKHGYYITHGAMEKLSAQAEDCREFLSSLAQKGDVPPFCHVIECYSPGLVVQSLYNSVSLGK